MKKHYTHPEDTAMSLRLAVKPCKEGERGEAQDRYLHSHFYRRAADTLIQAESVGRDPLDVLQALLMDLDDVFQAQQKQLLEYARLYTAPPFVYIPAQEPAAEPQKMKPRLYRYTEWIAERQANWQWAPTFRSVRNDRIEGTKEVHGLSAEEHGRFIGAAYEDGTFTWVRKDGRLAEMFFCGSRDLREAQAAMRRKLQEEG